MQFISSVPGTSVCGAGVGVDSGCRRRVVKQIFDDNPHQCGITPIAEKSAVPAYIASRMQNMATAHTRDVVNGVRRALIGMQQYVVCPEYGSPKVFQTEVFWLPPQLWRNSIGFRKINQLASVSCLKGPIGTGSNWGTLNQLTSKSRAT